MDANILNDETVQKVVAGGIIALLSWLGGANRGKKNGHSVVITSDQQVEREVSLRIAVHDLRNDFNVIVGGINRISQEDPANEGLQERTSQLLTWVERARVTLDRIPRK